jgi:hypothetical protein
MRSYLDRNPLYGSVYLYVAYAIRNNVLENKSEYTLISDNATYILILHGISMVFLWAWLSAEQYYDVDLVDGWNTGIFYDV